MFLGLSTGRYVCGCGRRGQVDASGVCACVWGVGGEGEGGAPTQVEASHPQCKKPIHISVGWLGLADTFGSITTAVHCGSMLAFTVFPNDSISTFLYHSFVSELTYLLHRKLSLQYVYRSRLTKFFRNRSINQSTPWLTVSPMQEVAASTMDN